MKSDIAPNTGAATAPPAAAAAIESASPAPVRVFLAPAAAAPLNPPTIARVAALDPRLSNDPIAPAAFPAGEKYGDHPTSSPNPPAAAFAIFPEGRRSSSGFSLIPVNPSMSPVWNASSACVGRC